MGERRLLDRLQGPESTRLFQIDSSPRVLLFCPIRLARIWRAHLDPSHEVRNLLVRKLPAGWHLQARVPVADRLDEQAITGASWHDRGTPTPPVEESLALIETQATPRCLRLWPVAEVAVLDQNRPDPGFEKVGFFLRDLSPVQLRKQTRSRYQQREQQQP